MGLIPDAGDLLAQLVKALRGPTQYGIPARMPAHREPPYRAKPFRYSWSQTVAAAGTQTFPQPWTSIDDTAGQTDAPLDPAALGLAGASVQVPSGLVTYVTRIACFAAQNGGVDGAADLNRQCRWSLLRPSGESVFQGSRRAAPQSFSGDSGVRASASVKIAHPDVCGNLPAHLRAFPGDVWTWTLTNTSGVASVFFGLIEGYQFPSVNPASDTIGELMQD